MNSSKWNPILTLEYMCNEKENQFFDRKSSKKSVKDIADHISGFANASGGTLVIGIADNGKIEGFQECPDKYNEFLKATSTDYLKIIPKYINETLEVINSKGIKDKILLIHIQPSPNALVRTVRDEVFLRQGDSTNRLSLEQVKILEYDRREISFEDQINLNTSINDIDLEMAEMYKESIMATEKNAIDVLRARRFIVKKDHNEFLTNAGVLLFGKDPSIFFPTARIRVIKFDGIKMQTGENLNIVKEHTFAFPLYKLIKETQKFVDTQLREFNHLDSNGKFITVPEYPKFAWQEGITNAVTHRNYAISGEHTKILIYDDRMEIISPGKLPGFVTVDNIRDERYARNPQISRVLTDLGLVKELNEGVRRIYNEMKQFFLEEPEYIETNNMLLKLTLKNNIVMRNRRSEENLLKEKNISREWDKLTIMEQNILQFIYDKGMVSTSQVENYIDRSRPTALRLLNKLENQELIEWIGSSTTDPKRKYRIKLNEDNR